MIRLDLIRRMSAYDLAWLFMEFRVDAYAKANGDEPILPCCQMDILTWLTEPVDELGHTLPTSHDMGVWYEQV